MRSAALALAVLAGWSAAIAAQPAPAAVVPASREESVMEGSVATIAQRLAEARAQLQQVIRSRSDADAPEPGQHRPQQRADKQRLLDWLLDLQGEKVKRLEDLLALQDSPDVKAEDDALVRALQGQPPYSAVKIDALRDEIDGLKENLAAAEAGLRANQTEISNLQSQLKARAAAVRRAAERHAGVGQGGDPAAREDAEQVKLLHRVTEAELSISLLDQEALKLRSTALAARIRELTTVVARVLPDQDLAQDELAAQRQQLRMEQDELAKEAVEAGRRYVRHSRQRDQLVKTNGAGGGQANGQAALLDLAIKTDNATRKGLDDLQVLVGLSGDSWERRYVLMSSIDPEQRRAALAGLQEVRQKLTDWRNLSHTRQDSLRTEIREQRMRMGNLPPEAPGRQVEDHRLNLLLQQAAIAERVEVAATRLERQVSRWLADYEASQGGAAKAQWAGLRDRLGEVLNRIWNQELFIAEDVSEVDGRRVPIQYGVTVGKSVGMVALFVLGYGTFSRLTHLIQLLLVRRFRISSQLASVVRRWTTIVFAIALVILVLNLARIPLSMFAFLGGALAIGVGFGAQTIIKNFISGLIVLFERQIRIGDIVELGGVTGHVTAVDLRATTVRSFNGVEALIPNANFIENQVINWTYSNCTVRHEIKIGIAYGSDLRHAQALFLAAAAANASVLRDPAPEVFVEDFGDSAIAVVLVYWVELENPISPRRVASDLRCDISGRLAEADIAIPFPQREVRVAFAEPLPAGGALERSGRTVHDY
jgi:small-conductance mechanosensitive channel